MLPVKLSGHVLKLADDTSFHRFVFEYEKRTFGLARILEATAFRRDGTIINASPMKLHKAPGKFEMDTRKFPFAYDGHLVLTKDTMVAYSLKTHSDYLLIPKQTQRAGRSLPYVSYSLHQMVDTTTRPKGVSKIKRPPVIIEDLDPSPPAD